MDNQILFKWIIIITTCNTFYAFASSVASCKYNTADGVIDCRNVKIGTLTADMYPVNARNLYLRNTGLSTLEHNVFAHLISLQYLELSLNSLESLDHRLFNNLTELQFLDLGFNNLKSLTDKRLFESQRKLVYLHLEFSHLTTMSAEVLHPLVSLKRLYLVGNPFVCNCQLYPTVLWCEQKCLITEAECDTPSSNKRSLWATPNYENCTGSHETASSNMNTSVDDKPDATPCSISCVYTSSFEYMECMDIDLGDLKAYKYPVNITTIRVLDLCNTRLSTLEANVFSHLNDLLTLYLEKNLLETLDHRLFANLTKLLILDLSDNRLMYVSDERLFASQGKLKTLSLAGNRLVSISEELIMPLLSLKNLYLSTNPLDCNCELRATFIWCEQRNVYTEATCEEPRLYQGSSWKVLKGFKSCDAQLAHDDAQVSLICVVALLSVCCGFVFWCGFCYLRRRKRSGSQNVRAAEFNDECLRNENVTSGAQRMVCFSTAPDISGRSTNRFASTQNATTSQQYDDTENVKVSIDKGASCELLVS